MQEVRSLDSSMRILNLLDMTADNCFTAIENVTNS